MSRRRFFRRAGIGAAALAGGALAGRWVLERSSARSGTDAPPPRAQAPVHHDDLPTAPSADVVAFLGPIAAGTVVGAWTVAQIHGVFRGALPFVLVGPDQRRVQVDLMADDAASPRGVARTLRGQLYLVNAGRGDRQTPASLEQAIRELAARLSEREATSRVALVSHAERHRLHPGGVFVVAL